ncbi:MAG TPA: SpoVR family protein [Hyphomicrobiaceae bacterium]|nr:SpoVR family protein [Hyphomicrobiaceae bacterium]
MPSDHPTNPGIELPPRRGAALKPLFDGAEWDFKLVNDVYDVMHGIAIGEMGLDIYPNQIEVITAEQMLDAYSSIGMPLMYRHWSFGKRFAYDEAMYRKGLRSLAFEIVINSNPCINYIMEENTMTMQALVIAHAAFGHNHFFKNNYQFRQWTQADHIIDYLAFAKAFVAECEEKYGQDAVESVLDAAHALMNQGVSRQLTVRQRNPLRREIERERTRREHVERTQTVLDRTLPEINRGEPTEKTAATGEQRRLGLPEENILYFLEKHAPKLADWQRELLRIVRNLAQYFYPQRQTKMMNEGCATFTHYEILNRLYERGQLTEGSMLEFLHSHSSVVFQPAFNDRRYSGMNPYALGFAMMRDIQRICTEPTSEDRDWFPDFAGNGDPMGTLRDAWANFRDESFVLQYLSPKVMRDFRLFALRDDHKDSAVVVRAIHNERGYREVRRQLASTYDVAAHDPDLQVTDADLSGSRRLVITHTVRNGVTLDKTECERTLQHLARLWGYRVRLIEIEEGATKVLREHEVLPMP